MLSDLPKSYPLTGTDYFLLVLDKKKRQFSPQSCICRLAIDIEGDLNIEEVRMQLEEFELLSWLGSLRLKLGFPLQLPKWQSLAEKRAIPLYEWYEADLEEIPSTVLNRDLGLSRGNALVFDLVRRPHNRTTVVLSWHHALMDARGGEMLLKLVFGGTPPNSANSYFSPAPPKETFVARLNQSKRAKNIVIKSTASPVASLIGKKLTPNPNLHYRHLNFSPEETLKIDETCITVGARFKKSIFYMAATALSLNAVLKRRGMAPRAFCVPVPQDLRRRGAFGPMVSNQVSFIFFRIAAEVLDSLTGCIQAINNQMVDQVREEKQKSFASMMDLFRRLPLSLYSRMLTRSLNANSFFFSDTGETLSDLKTVLGRTVLAARHFPPNTYPPGFTIIFTRFNKALTATLAYAEEALSTQEAAAFAEDLKSYLQTGSSH